MLAVEDAIVALEWAKSVGGLDGMIARTEANAAALDRIVQQRNWLGHLAEDPASRSKTSVCLTVDGADNDFIKRFAKLLEAEGAAYDIAGYRDAPPGLRIWCGATVDTADIEALGPWLDWAWEQCQWTAVRRLRRLTSRQDGPQGRGDFPRARDRGRRDRRPDAR